MPRALSHLAAGALLLVGAPAATAVLNADGAVPHAAVGALDDGCIATQIAPQWLITAAHCLGDGGRPVFATLGNSTERHETSEPVLAPGGADVALLGLRRMRPGALITLGISGCDAPADVTLMSAQHDATSLVRAAPRQAFLTLDAGCAPQRVMSAPLAIVMCKGDSGAPLVREGHIVGVVSEGFIAHKGDRCTDPARELSIGRAVDVGSPDIAAWIQGTTARTPRAPRTYVSPQITRRGALRVVMYSDTDWALPPIGAPVRLMRRGVLVARGAVSPFDDVTIRRALHPGHYRIRVGYGTAQRSATIVITRRDARLQAGGPRLLRP